jgi:hypothetical protein
MAYGFRRILEPEVIGMVLSGFLIFSAGMAARTLVPSSGERPRWLRRLSAVVPLGLIVIVLASTLSQLPSSAQLDPEVPPIIGRLYDSIGAFNVWLWSGLPDPILAEVSTWLEPERLAWTLAMMLVAAFVLELAFPRLVGDQRAPFDAITESPGRMVRFLWLTTALTAICLVAVPTLLVLGQVFVHIRYSIDNWSVQGWPAPF